MANLASRRAQKWANFFLLWYQNLSSAGAVALGGRKGKEGLECMVVLVAMRAMHAMHALRALRQSVCWIHY